ncbi:ParB/RepB/Spo0J family partition protein [Caulobacter flavus]|uniref:ParB/RepB/Spo0J family partition protein n=1 Tax=Caulobacter flavus TaxID=1679497 RepID=UPI0015DEFDFA|nr:ParB/RepB/Spo0J family partition protein [Caulobacter flavus]
MSSSTTQGPAAAQGTASKAVIAQASLRTEPSILTETGQVFTGTERVYPLNKLKRDPDNVRKAGHSEAVIERRAASILAKGLIQLPVVRPERRADGSETGYALVTAGEGRRLALRLLAKRRLIPKTAPVRCLVDERNLATEVSLEENYAREPLHPADEFEAFRTLAEGEGLGAETIAARFGVTPAVVRERLRLGAVHPDLIQRYRDGALTLDQLTAFAVSEDRERQLQVWELFADAKPHPTTIRRAMTEKTVQATDRRVMFVGIEAYVAAGGHVIRDLFTEDHGGYLSDPALVDRLVVEKLTAMVERFQAAEGWKWSQIHLDYPHGHGLARVWPKPVVLGQDRLAEREALTQEYEALGETWGAVEDLPAEVEARLSAIEADLAQDVVEAYDPDDLARAGVWIVLGYDGQPRVERGLVRPEDVLQAPADETGPDEEAAGDGDGDSGGEGDEVEEVEETGRGAMAPLSAKLVADLTAHRTAGLRLALSNDPDLALVALTHALALCAFHGAGRATCLDIRAGSAFLPDHGEGVKTSPAYEALRTRHDQWAKQAPSEPEAMWDFVVGLDGDSRASLLAYCVARSVDAVRAFSGSSPRLDHAEVLATATDLDMTAFWSPTQDRYLGRVTKGHVLSALAEAVSPDTASRLSGLKKGDLIAAAEPDLVKARWLPALLRTRSLTVAPDPDGDPAQAEATNGVDEEVQAPAGTEPPEAGLLAAE